MAAEFKYGDYVKEAIGVYKANLVPLLVGGICHGIPIANFIIMVNIQAAVLKYRKTGEAIQIGDLFDFDNAVDKLVVGLVHNLPLGITATAGPLITEYPKLGMGGALSAGWAFGSKNIAGMIIASLLLAVVGMLGMILCFVGIFLTIPIIDIGIALIYEDHREGVLAAAKEAGIEIA